MSWPTVVATAHRIGEHVWRHDLADVRIVFHGGEPLLAGPERIASTAALVRHCVPSSTRVRFAIQTNGVLLDETALRVLQEHGVRASVSLDGKAVDHDRHRRQANGHGSYAAVRAGLELLGQPRFRDIFAGLLCTVDLDHDPIQTYRALLEFGPPAVDFLLPHGNWSNPPKRRGEGSPATPYAEWLIAIFDEWYSAVRRETGIQLFEEIMNLVLGGTSRTELIGLTPVALLVIDTDGSMEQVDSLKSAYAGAAAVGLDVFGDAFDAALEHPAIMARQLGAAALCSQCRACEVGEICGGGFYPHRYRGGAGYLNPSVYCPDLMKLIDHIARRVRHDTEALLRR